MPWSLFNRKKRRSSVIHLHCTYNLILNMHSVLFRTMQNWTRHDGVYVTDFKYFDVGLWQSHNQNVSTMYFKVHLHQRAERPLIPIADSAVDRLVEIVWCFLHSRRARCAPARENRRDRPRNNSSVDPAGMRSADWSVLSDHCSSVAKCGVCKWKWRADSH